MIPHIPTIETENLVLGPIDMDHIAAFTAFARTEASRFLGGPVDNDRDAWDSCLTHAGQWLVRGYGTLWVSEGAGGTPIGRVGLWHPNTYREPELSWVIYPAWQGKGHAYEATRAMRHWAGALLGLPPLHSVIDPGNARSLALAGRLGCHLEGTRTLPSGSQAQIWRHPPQEVQP